MIQGGRTLLVDCGSRGILGLRVQLPYEVGDLTVELENLVLELEDSVLVFEELVLAYEDSII